MLCSKLLGSPRLSGIVVSTPHQREQRRIHAYLLCLGSSRGRGTRAAAWFADYLNDCHDDRELMESVVLLEGIEGWTGAGDEYIAKMQEYDAEIWNK